MKRNLSLFLIVLFFLPSLACGSFTTNLVRGSGDIITETFEVRDFDRVALEGFGNVFIEQGQTESLSVQTDDNIMSLLDIKVRGNELELGIQPGYDVTPTKSIIFNLKVKNLNAISLGGSGNFNVEPVRSKSLDVSIQGSGDVDIKGLTADELTLDLNGSGNITIQDLQLKNLETSLQGSGDIKLEGKAAIQKVTVKGSGNYLAGELETTAADISIPGSADITVWANEELNVRINGSGTVQYYGQPRIDQSDSGSGKLISLGDK